MAEIKVAKVQPAQRMSKRRLYASVCYYYPRYSLQDVSKMPARDLILLLEEARRIEAVKMQNLTAIVAAPHSKNKNEVSKLLSHFQDLAKD